MWLSLTLNYMSRSNIDDKNLSVELVMTPLPLDTANASDSALDLAKKMKRKVEDLLW